MISKVKKIYQKNYALQIVIGSEDSNRQQSNLFRKKANKVLESTLVKEEDAFGTVSFSLNEPYFYNKNVLKCKRLEDLTKELKKIQ